MDRVSPWFASEVSGDRVAYLGCRIERTVVLQHIADEAVNASAAMLYRCGTAHVGLPRSRDYTIERFSDVPAELHEAIALSCMIHVEADFGVGEVQLHAFL